MDAVVPDIGLLLWEWEEQAERGDVLSVEEFCRRYPGLDSAEFERRLRQLRAMDRVLNLDEAKSECDGAWPELADYRIEKELGRGGMGVIYTAHDRTLDRRVALKVLPTMELPEGPYAQRRERRFAREAQALAKLRHPNIVPIYAAQLVHGQSYFVMEFIVAAVWRIKSKRMRKEAPTRSRY